MPLITVEGPHGPPVSYRFGGDLITVGRAPDSDLVLHDDSVSRQHLELRRRGDDWVAVDLGSRNGTRRNGARVLGEELLESGDRLAVGKDGCTLVFDEEVAGAQPDGSVLAELRETVSERGTAEPTAPVLVGTSAAMAEVREAIDAVAHSDAPVLVTGENGTGKELVARAIHESSARSAAPFVIVNCPALPPGVIESELFGIEAGVATGVEARVGLLQSADGGTLFLDEIGDLAPDAQAKLLRFLQDGTLMPVGGRQPVSVDARVIAATNQDLDEAIAEGRFRRDLYHRLKVVHVRVPPLRERLGDVPALVEHFSSQGDPVVVSDEAMEHLLAYSYPGNVRELAAILERARLFARAVRTIRPEHLPEEVRDRGPDGGGLWRRVVHEGEPFFEVVQEPFLRRELSRDEVRELVRRGLSETGSLKALAELFGVRERAGYKKLVDFLRNNRLRPDD